MCVQRILVLKYRVQWLFNNVREDKRFFNTLGQSNCLLFLIKSGTICRVYHRRQQNIFSLYLFLYTGLCIGSEHYCVNFDKVKYYLPQMILCKNCISFFENVLNLYLCLEFRFIWSRDLKVICKKLLQMT